MWFSIPISRSHLWDLNQFVYVSVCPFCNFPAKWHTLINGFVRQTTRVQIQVQIQVQTPEWHSFWASRSRLTKKINGALLMCNDKC